MGRRLRFTVRSRQGGCSQHTRPLATPSTDLPSRGPVVLALSGYRDGDLYLLIILYNTPAPQTAEEKASKKKLHLDSQPRMTTRPGSKRRTPSRKNQGLCRTNRRAWGRGSRRVLRDRGHREVII